MDAQDPEALDAYLPVRAYYRLLDRCQYSRIYHKKREQFFDFVDNVTKFIAIVSGATAFSRIAGDLPVMSFFLLLTSSASLIVGYAKRARVHADLAKAFNELEAEVVEAGILLTEAQAQKLNGKLVRCELNEPRTLGVLVQISQNEVLQATDRPTHPIPRWKRALAHFWDFDV